MDNVVQLHRAKKGDTAFMLCACMPEDPLPYMIVALQEAQPLIVALVCPGCDKQLNVVNGFVTGEAGPSA